MILPSSLAFSLKVDGSLAAICDGCRALSRRSPYGDGETQCSTVRSDEVLDGPSLRSEAGIRRCGFIHRLSRRRPSTFHTILRSQTARGPGVSPIAGAEPPSTSYPSFWCARSASTGDHQPSCPAHSGVPPSASTRTDQAASLMLLRSLLFVASL